MPYPSYGNPGFTTLPYIPSGTADIAGVTWVSGLQEVQSAIVPYGKQLYMQRDQDIFYVKDHTGSLKAFRFQEIPLPSNDPSNYVTKQEFDELKAKYEQLIQQQPSSSSFQSEPVAISATDTELQWNTGASTAGVLQQGSTDGNYGVTVEQPA